jgi:hypothetical protein
MRTQLSLNTQRGLGESSTDDAITRRGQKLHRSALCGFRKLLKKNDYFDGSTVATSESAAGLEGNPSSI